MLKPRCEVIYFEEQSNIFGGANHALSLDTEVKGPHKKHWSKANFMRVQVCIVPGNKNFHGPLRKKCIA